MKRLIVCCDGTWNTPDMEDNGVAAPTNVYKFYNLLASRGDGGTEQRRYYQPGVGTDGFLDNIAGGALGLGVDEKINDAFLWLGLNYDPDDEIYIVGFSRGAFVARCLAGYLGKGLVNFRKIPTKEIRSVLKEAYKRVYEPREDENGDPVSFNLSRVLPDSKLFTGNTSAENALPIFHRDYAIKVSFVGVWDTVGSLGIPDDLEVADMLLDKKDRWQFHDRNLGYHVETGRHAMGLDEIRSSFTVTHWSNTRKLNSTPKHPDVQEMWFPGVHGDVGGGYADEALSAGPLLWMMEQAREKGLAFRKGAFNAVEQCYDPCGEIHNSFKGAFAKLPARPRNVPFLKKPSSPSTAVVRIWDGVFQRQEMVCPKFTPYRPSVALDVGEKSEPNEIYAEQRWNYTGIYLHKGSYFFEGSGLWMDSKDVCDWKGTEDGHFTAGDAIRAFGSFFGVAETAWKKLFNNEKAQFALTKRVEEIDWFRMVGCIANDRGTDSSKVVANDGSPVPHECVDLASHTQQNPLVVKHPGYLYAFANDVWSTYENNDGVIRLVVHRVK